VTPLVSIGIPTYNRSALLRQAIQSVLQQTCQDFEVIVSDDCSTDDTAAVVAGFGDARLRYQRTPYNLRPPRNWNECVRLARGEFFALLPDDDVYCPTFLERMTRALAGEPAAGFAQCGFYAVDERLRPYKTVLPSPPAPFCQGEEALIWQMERLECIPAALLFRRAALLDLGLWREDYFDDWALIVRLAYRRGFVSVPAPLACNRLHGANLNLQMRSAGDDIILHSINQMADVFGAALPATPRLEALRARLERQLSEHCVLLALGALRRADWQKARFHFARARRLYALAGLDPRFIGLALRIRRQLRQERRRLAAAQRLAPAVILGAANP
jgi:glycosyltransferase involved in cell wall biosynthesis